MPKRLPADASVSGKGKTHDVNSEQVENRATMFNARHQISMFQKDIQFVNLHQSSVEIVSWDFPSTRWRRGTLTRLDRANQSPFSHLAYRMLPGSTGRGMNLRIIR